MSQSTLTKPTPRLSRFLPSTRVNRPNRSPTTLMTFLATTSSSVILTATRRSLRPISTHTMVYLSTCLTQLSARTPSSGIRDDVCFDRFGRLGPYGFGYSKDEGGSGVGNDTENSNSDAVWAKSGKINYDNVDWARRRIDALKLISIVSSSLIRTPWNSQHQRLTDKVEKHVKLLLCGATPASSGPSWQ